MLYRSSYTWEQANAFVAGLGKGAHLATITNSEENQYVKQMAIANANANVWLGGYLDGSVWRWVTGENVQFNDWASGQPDHSVGVERWMTVQGSSRQWNDTTNAEYFLVEYEPQIDSITLSNEYGTDFLNMDYTKHEKANTVISFEIDEQADLDSIVYPDVTYFSSDNSVATVDEHGEITAQGPGFAHIFAEANDGDLMAMLDVYCYHITSMNFGEYNNYKTPIITRNKGKLADLGYNVTWNGEFNRYYFDTEELNNPLIMLKDAGIYYTVATQNGQSVEDLPFHADAYMNAHITEWGDIYVICEPIGGVQVIAKDNGWAYVGMEAHDLNGRVIFSGSCPVLSIVNNDGVFYLPQHLKTIQADAFVNTNAKIVVIPSGVTKIEAGAFSGVDLDAVIVEGGNTHIEAGAFSSRMVNSGMFFCLSMGGNTEKSLKQIGANYTEAFYSTDFE